MATITTTSAYIASAKPDPYYRLSYDPTTKKVIRLDFTAVNQSTPHSLFCATTYAEIAAQATALQLTGLPAQVTGQP